MPAEHRPAFDYRAVGGFLDIDAQCTQPSRHHGNTVGLLDPQFGRAGDSGRAGRRRGRDEQDGKFVDHVRHPLLGHIDAAQRRVAHDEIGNRFSAQFTLVAVGGYPRPSTRSAWSSPVRRGFMPTSRSRSSDPGTSWPRR